MNLFVVGWNLPEELRVKTLDELRRATEIYPNLDPDSIWHCAAGEGFAASMRIADAIAAPRRYVWRTDGQAVFYSGTMVDRTGMFDAHDAHALATHWPILPEVLEGHFAAVKITEDPPGIELLTDFLGGEHVFYRRDERYWLLSNSARLLLNITGAKAPDPLGVSLFLCLGRVGEDRTFHRDIRLLPGGQRYEWRLGSVDPATGVYFARAGLARMRKRAFGAEDAGQLAEQLRQIVGELAHRCAPLRAPLTGGRDTRLIASLLIGSGIPAQYYTFGPDYSPDIKIAAQIARTFNLPHDARITTDGDILAAWGLTVHRFIAATDGMANLEHIHASVEHPTDVDHLGVSLWGAGGEMARCTAGHPRLFLRRVTAEEIYRHLVSRRIRESGGLIQWEATALAQEHLRRFVRQVVDEGFPPVDALDLFYVFETTRRWAYGNGRITASLLDLFSPFCTRPFVQATFATPAVYRYAEAIHRRVIRRLEPALLSIPFDKPGHYSEMPLVNQLRWWGGEARRSARRPLGRLALRAHAELNGASSPAPWWGDVQRAPWLEAKRDELRSLCLDQRDSFLWSFVDRAVFERITSPGASAEERSRRLKALYRVAGLFYYASALGF